MPPLPPQGDTSLSNGAKGTAGAKPRTVVGHVVYIPEACSSSSGTVKTTVLMASGHYRCDRKSDGGGGEERGRLPRLLSSWLPGAL